MKINHLNLTVTDVVEAKHFLDKLNQRIKDDGFQVEAPAIVHGSYTF